MNITSTESSSADAGKLRGGRAFGRKLLICLIVMVAAILTLVGLLPQIISKTPLSRTLLSIALADKDVDATFDRVELSWFTGTKVDNLVIHGRTNESKLSIPLVKSDAGLYGWLLLPAAPKSVKLTEPSLQIVVDKAMELDAFSRTADTDPDRRIDFEISDAEVTVQGRDFPEPTSILESLNLQGRLLRAKNKTQLIINAGQVAREKKVSAALCDASLKYVAPILAETTWAEGDVSIDLGEWRIHPGDPTATTGSGTLTIHSLEAGLKSPLAIAVGELVSQVIDRDLPSKVKLANDSTIQISMRDGRVNHEGLEFGLPEISPELVIRSRGSVGVDQTLDLLIEVPLPLHLLGDGPLAQLLGSQTLKLPVTGTIDEPKIEFEGDGQLLSEVLARLSAEAGAGELNFQEIIDQIRKRREQRDPDRPGLLDRIRERREERGPLFRRR